jgi:hypothetical protein
MEKAAFANWKREKSGEQKKRIVSKFIEKELSVHNQRRKLRGSAAKDSHRGPFRLRPRSAVHP